MLHRLCLVVALSFPLMLYACVDAPPLADPEPEAMPAQPVLPTGDWSLAELEDALRAAQALEPSVASAVEQALDDDTRILAQARLLDLAERYGRIARRAEALQPQPSAVIAAARASRSALLQRIKFMDEPR